MSRRERERWSWGMILLAVVAGGLILTGCGLLTKDLVGNNGALNPLDQLEFEGDLLRPPTVLDIGPVAVGETVDKEIVLYIERKKGGQTFANGAEVTITFDQARSDAGLKAHVTPLSLKVTLPGDWVSQPDGTLSAPAKFVLKFVVPAGFNFSRTYVLHFEAAGQGTTKSLDMNENVQVRFRQKVQDTTPPTCTIVAIQPPCSNASSWPGGFSGTSTDNVGVKNVEVYVDGVLAGNATVSGTNWTFAYTPVEGKHEAYAIAFDAAGNWTQSNTIGFTYDTTDPVVEILYPEDNKCYNAATWTGTIKGTATDVIGVVRVEVYVNGVYQGLADISALSDWTFAFTPAVSDSYEVCAKAYDCAGNVGQDCVKFVFDNSPPSVGITAPAAGCYRAATWPGKIDGTAGDDIGVVKVEVYVNGVKAGDATLLGLAWSFNWTPAADGVYTLHAKAYDCAGNAGSSSSVQYTYDTTRPVITITTPPNGACYIAGAVVNAAFTVTDNLDPSPSVSSTVPNGSPIDTTPGDHSFTVTATDCAGNTRTVTHKYSAYLISFVGLRPPFNSRPTIKRGSTFPIKWGYDLPCGLINSSNAQFTLRIYAGVDDTGTLIDNTFPGKSGGPRYDPVARQWIFNWQTPKTLTPGSYAIYIIGAGGWPTGGPFVVEVRE